MFELCWEKNFALKILNHLDVCKQLSQNIVLKKSGFFRAVCKYHNSDPILNSVFPSTFKNTSIGPSHSAKANFYVVHVLAPVMTSSCPFELSITMFNVIVIFSLVHVRIFFCTRFLPSTLPLFATVYKHATVNVSISPAILTISFCLAIVIFSQKHISIGKYI